MKMPLNRVAWKITLCLALSLVIESTNSQGAGIIFVGPTGVGPLNFSQSATTPPTNGWSTLSIAGTGNDWFDEPSLDVAVQSRGADDVNLLLDQAGATPPTTSATGFPYNTTLLALQSRPTADAGVMLMGTFLNDSGADQSTIVLSYDFALQTPAVGELPGWRVYYSLTGASNSWTLIPALSGNVTVGTQSATQQLSSVLFTGFLLYLLWVDDNANIVTDESYTMDNFALNFQAACAPAPSGLVASWRANGNAVDSFGTNNGTLVNGTTFAPGIAGQTFSFDGVDDIVDIPHSAELNPTQAITVGAWIRPRVPLSQQTNGYTRLVDKDRLVGGQSGYDLSIIPDGFILFCAIGEGEVYRCVTSPLPDLAPTNLFTHVVGTYDSASGTARLYINGSFVSEYTGGPMLIGFNPDTPMTIGGNSLRPPSNNFHGDIDEVAIFNRALTSNEIASIYAAGSSGMCAPPTITCPPNLVRSNTVGQCSVVVSFAPSADGVPTPTVLCSPPSGSAFAAGTNTVSCTAQNSSGTANCSFTIRVVDAEAPVFTCATNRTVQCGTAWTFATSTATDNCDGTNLSVVFNTTTNFLCGGSYAATRTWHATDSSGNSATCSQTVTVGARVPPAYAFSFGTLGSGAGQLRGPVGIAVDASGNVYVADRDNNRIQKFSSSGTFLLQWGSLGTNSGQFNLPFDLAVDFSGNVFVADYNNNRVQKFSSVGVFLLQWGGAGSGAGQFSLPVGVALDTSGNVYISDAGNNRVQKFTINGTFLRQWPSPGARGLAVDPLGNIYVVDQTNARILKFRSDGTLLTQWGSLGAGPGQFGTAGPNGIAIDNAGNVCVGDSGNDRVTVFDANGNYLIQFGSFGSGPGQFQEPDRLAFSPSGTTLYISEFSNNRIQALNYFAPSPIITCRTNRTVECGTAWSFDQPTATDACDGTNVTISVVSTVTNALCGNSYSATRTWRATDSCTNSTTCSQTITVVDTTPPALACPSNFSVECGTSWNFGTPTLGTDCSPTTLLVVSTTTNALCGSTFQAKRVWTLVDACTNVSATCTQTVTVIDTMPPAIACGPSRTVQCGTPWSFDLPTALDSCNGTLGLAPDPQCRPGPPTGGGINRCYDDGFVYVDNSGNMGGTTWNWGYQSPAQFDGYFLVFHSRSNINPTTVQLITDTYDLSGIFPPEPPYSGTPQGPGPRIADAPLFRSIQVLPMNGVITVLDTTTNQLAGGNYRVTRTWQATDACGNMSNCSQAITVVDTTPPQIVCSTNIIRDCTGPGTPVTFTPSVTDNCDASVAVVCTPPSGTLFTRGTTGVTCVATDDNTNSSQCSFTVTIRDLKPPQILCPGNIIAAEAPRGSGFAIVNYPPPPGNDICDGPVAVSCSPASGTSFPLGTNAVVCVASDTVGNSNSCAFTVRVIPYRLRIVTSTASAGTGSLRRAVEDANAAPGENMIVFEIPGPGPYVINLPSPLPEITSPLIIDGYSQTGLSNAPVIELRGSGSGDGLFITAGDSTIQGLVLSGFTTGVRIGGNGGNVIRGNFIGTDRTGSLASGNSGDGIYIGSPTNIIGGPAVAAANLISGNAANGVHLKGLNAFGNLIQGNLIGTALNGTSAISNGLDGVFMEMGAANNFLGGPVAAGGNTIAFSGRNGVSLASDAGVGNAIRRNIITANGALGIDLGTNGVTPNDNGDADAGPNQLQNFPTLTDAVSIEGITTILGTLSDFDDGTYHLDFFLNNTADPSGFGEGALYLGSKIVTVANGGNQEFSFIVPISATFTQFVAATATDLANNTSEFSPVVQVRTPPILQVQPVATNAPIGSEVTFCATASGTPPIRWQWRHNGVIVDGADQRCYTIPAADLMDGGSYTVVAFNDVGAFTTIPAALNLPINNAAPSGADNFVDRVRIFGTNGFAAGNNRGATNGEPGEPLHAGKRGGKSVWYTWTAPVTGIATFGLTGSTFDTLLGIYTGDVVNNLRTNAGDEDGGGFFTSALRFNATRDIDYHIAIDGSGGKTGDFILQWSVEDTQKLLPQFVTQPISQTVAPDSTAIFKVIAQRVCGQGQTNCTDPGNFPDNELKQLEYRWFLNGVAMIPPETNNILVITNVGTNDLGQYTVQVTYDGRSIMSQPAALQINSIDSQVQDVQAVDKIVDAVDSTLVLRFGTFPGGSSLFAAGEPYHPSAVAAFVSGYSGFQTFNNSLALTDESEPTPCGTLTTHSMWIPFNVGETGVMHFTGTGTPFATLLAVYQQNPNLSLTLLTCTNNGTLSVPVSPGQNYTIACDGISGNIGNIQLSCSLVTPSMLTSLTKTNGNQLQLSSHTGMKFEIQIATNLPNWVPFLTTTSLTNPFIYLDTTGTNINVPQRFYRAKMLPVLP